MFTSVQYANGSKNVLTLNMQRQHHNSKTKMRKINRRRPRSVDGTELGHFTLLTGSFSEDDGEGGHTL